MTNPEALPERVDRIEQKLDSLAASIDRRFDDVDRRFNEVDRQFNEVDRQFNEVTDALVEQRRYTEFAFDRLDSKLTTVDTKLDEVLRILRR